jgi:hypothetical protein
VEPCPTCRVTLTPGKRLGEVEGTGSFNAHVRNVKRGASGRYFASQYSWTGGEILVFDSAGRFERRLTREGAGPGETRGLGVFTLGPHDTIYIADVANGRMSVFDPQMAFNRVVANAPIARAQSLLVMRNWLVVNASVPTSDRIGYTLHLLRRDDLQLHKSMGLEPEGYRADRERKGLRLMTPARDGGFWAAEHGAYRLARYDSSGEHVETLSRNASWFPSHSVDPPRSVEPAKPLIVGIREDSLGRLWVLVVVSDEKTWRRSILPAGSRMRDGGLSPLPLIVDNDGYFDTVIEVIDPARATVARVARVNSMLLFDVAENELATEEEDRDGRTFVRLWSIQHPTIQQRRKVP